ncbi:unnamed protein product [Lymnaea stagnalis]|uniref:Uncharacterized protein n=1 Tax=Lymnaea stagnalis TaxID=6523 RepID=A0AAV2IHD4_LYMST
MGIKGFTSNYKKDFKSRKSNRWQRICKAEKKKVLPKETIEVENVHLFSNEKLKNKLRNPKNNIKISGKKFRRLTKRLGHSLRAKSQMDVEVADAKSTKLTAKIEDAEMVELASSEQSANKTAPDNHAPSMSSSSSKKKKRGGKKHKKKVSAPSGDKSGPLFDQDGGWEDVDMAE